MALPTQGYEPGRPGPLDGVRVLDFSRLVAGNMLYKRAEVILARARAVAETERRKAEARARLA